MTLLISCGWVIIGQCVKFVWSLLTCVCRLLTIDLCMTTMESYHQFIDVTSMHEDTRVLYQQLYDGHRRIGRYSRWEPGIDCWLGKKRANAVWSMMTYRDMIRARDEWVGNAFMICRGFQWTMTVWEVCTQSCLIDEERRSESYRRLSISVLHEPLLHWSYIIPKYVHFKGRVKMHILSANQRKAISSMGMESSFLQIRRDVEQPNVVYVRRNRHMRKLT